MFFYFFRVSGGFIYLIDSKYNRYISSLSVANGFLGLRHDIVIGSDYDNSNIGNLSPTGTHRGKGFVSRGIQEGNTLFTSLKSYRVGTYVLGDTPTLSGNHILIADMVK